MKTTTQIAEVGVIVARFQSPFLHEGHLEILDVVRNGHPRVIVFLGNSPLRYTFNNPYDYATRRAMLEEKFPDIEVYYIDDVGDNELWSKNLDRQIHKTVGPNLKTVLYGSRDSFIRAYSGKYPTIELVPSKFVSATEIRKKVGIKCKGTQDFREGICCATQNQYPSVKPTVDLAIINFDTGEMLVARKPNQGKLRFVGGFIDPKKDVTAEGAAVREGKEETQLGLNVYGYIGSTLIDDWRYRSEQDKIMTFFYAMRYTAGTPVAKDDVEYVCWKKISEIQEDEIMAEHIPLLIMFKHWWDDKFPQKDVIV